MTIILVNEFTGQAYEPNLEGWGAQCRTDGAIGGGGAPDLLLDAELMATLRSVEWVAHSLPTGEVIYLCPVCFVDEGGHGLDCRLALTISALERRLDDKP